ncbi:MAG: FHA domain-containing protein [Fimbriimonadaceae bacterium]|nr:FHA domain-containing protein [Fimbriimonadaceae bacterium]
MTGEGPTLLVDLSNVCRDESISGTASGRASWRSYELLLQAVRDAGIKIGGVHLVADRNLRYLLDSRGVSEFDRAERAGRLEATPLADERLLEYAFGAESEFSGALVASMDRFDDFRRSYPEIQQNADRFVGWQSRNGILTAFLRDMGTSSHFEMSRKEEQSEFKERRIRRQEVAKRAESSYFRCEKESCIAHRLWPEHIRELPRYDDRRDDFLCTRCGGVLKSVGRRRPSAQLIVFVNGAERSRILLQQGETLAVGRSDSEDCVGLRRLLPGDEQSAISRRHLEFRWVGPDLTVSDLGSKNGTLVVKSSGSGPGRLRPGDAIRFGRGARVDLPDGISIELSGRRNSFEGERPVPKDPAEATDIPTRVVPPPS